MNYEAWSAHQILDVIKHFKTADDLKWGIPIRCDSMGELDGLHLRLGYVPHNNKVSPFLILYNGENIEELQEDNVLEMALPDGQISSWRIPGIPRDGWQWRIE